MALLSIESRYRCLLFAKYQAMSLYNLSVTVTEFIHS